MEFITNTKQTAYFFDITPRTIQNWVKAGCPKIARGKYNLKDVFNWHQENIIGNTGDDESLAEIKRQYWKVKTLRESIAVGRLKDKLISWTQVQKSWATRVGLVTSGLEAFVNRLPALLVGKSRNEIRKILQDEVYHLRDSYARRGKYCPPLKKRK